VGFGGSSRSDLYLRQNQVPVREEAQKEPQKEKPGVGSHKTVQSEAVKHLAFAGQNTELCPALLNLWAVGCSCVVNDFGCILFQSSHLNF
jgi:hypothetical protein